VKIETVGGERSKRREWTFDGTRKVVIGRGADAAVRIPDPESSRAHSAICRRDGCVFLRDMGSKNGTLLNGEPIGEAPLFNEDRIQIGGTVLRVTDIPPRAARVPSRPAFAKAEREVLLTLDHAEADVLRGVGSSVTAADLAYENRILREVGLLSQIMASQEEAQTILQRMLDEVRRLLAADVACVLTRASDQEDWWVRAASGAATSDGALAVSRTVIQKAIAEGHAVLLANAANDRRFEASQSIVVQGIFSAVCSPLRIGGAYSGVLLVDRRRCREAFGEMDLRLTATMANILGIFLEKEQYEADARKKARLAGIGEVVAGLAHHVKNIVTGFHLSIANLKMAHDRQRLDLVEPCLKSIVNLERRISDLMLNMLSYAKDRVPSPTEVDAAGMIEDLIGPYREQLEEKGIRFDYSVDPKTKHIYADERDLHTVLLNLVLNSVDALDSKAGNEKRIAIAVGPAPEGGVECRVRDTGPGISRENLAKLFASFFSTKGSRGTGLGLSVARKIVEEHRGTIAADSEEGRWTEFRIVWPPRPSA
jgi:signal transduction histidine kinase